MINLLHKASSQMNFRYKQSYPSMINVCFKIIIGLHLKLLQVEKLFDIQMEFFKNFTDTTEGLYIYFIEIKVLHTFQKVIKVPPITSHRLI